MRGRDRLHLTIPKPRLDVRAPELRVEPNAVLRHLACDHPRVERRLVVRPHVRELKPRGGDGVAGIDTDALGLAFLLGRCEGRTGCERAPVRLAVDARPVDLVLAGIEASQLQQLAGAITEAEGRVKDWWTPPAPPAGGGGDSAPDPNANLIWYRDPGTGELYSVPQQLTRAGMGLT